MPSRIETSRVIANSSIALSAITNAPMTKTLKVVGKMIRTVFEPCLVSLKGFGRIANGDATGIRREFDGNLSKAREHCYDRAMTKETIVSGVELNPME